MIYCILTALFRFSSSIALKNTLVMNSMKLYDFKDKSKIFNIVQFNREACWKILSVRDTNEIVLLEAVEKLKKLPP